MLKEISLFISKFLYWYQKKELRIWYENWSKNRKWTKKSTFNIQFLTRLHLTRHQSYWPYQKLKHGGQHSLLSSLFCTMFLSVSWGRYFWTFCKVFTRHKSKTLTIIFVLASFTDRVDDGVILISIWFLLDPSGLLLLIKD